jgi:hypothetical protein
MTLKNLLCLLPIFFCPSTGHAQQGAVATSCRIRVVLNDPANPGAELYYADQVGSISRLEFQDQNLSQPIMTQLVNGSLVFYDKPTVDLMKPEGSLAATCKVPTGSKQGAVVVLPSPGGAKPAYRLVFIADSAKDFPKGESRILTLLPTETAIEAGEHKLPIHPGQITRLPPVKKVSEYNMAQTNFYYKKGDAWTAFTERQLQYIDGFRRIFIVQIMPGAAQPTVLAISDSTTPQ